MDRDTVLLASAGSGICGAAAVVATESVLGAAPHKTSAAAGQVVLFGSLAMPVYPLLFGILGIARAPFGIYVGSTVHEVAQVVAIGKTIGGATAENAVIVKMIRVMMLAPFLIVLGWFAPRETQPTKTATAPRLPGFAIAFIVIAIVHPYLGLPARALAALRTHAGSPPRPQSGCWRPRPARASSRGICEPCCRRVHGRPQLTSTRQCSTSRERSSNPGSRSRLWLPMPLNCLLQRAPSMRSFASTE
jgi:hypothetical protein